MLGEARMMGADRAMQEHEECIDRLGALDADIRMVTHQIARVTNNNGARDNICCRGGRSCGR